jgi:class 3 adenylate cyclase
MLSDIEQWLGKLSLEKYVVVFMEAEIDFATLPFLTDDDLKELELPLGPRRKVSEAIKQLNRGTVLSSADSFDAAIEKTNTLASVTQPPPEPSSAAERRHLTVMFVDLVGSTEMSTQIDVEDMREIITSYQNTVASMVESHNGFVAKFMGDGVLCYFGWPQANEDDAGRAVRAGLAIISGVKLLNGPNGEQLSTRVGIASGVVVVGDLVGSGSSEEAAVVGETPNLAARLQGLAEPDQLVLPEETRSLLGNLFQLRSVGAHDLKGIAQPVQAYVVTGESTRESRFDASHSGTLTPIFGRTQELRLMEESWNRAQAGSGQMVLVSGEAGIGKSRLTRAMIDQIESVDHTRLTCHCSPYHTDSAFYPIIGQLIFTAGIESADDDSTRLDKLERMQGVDSENVALLAAMLGIEADARYGALDLTPQQQRSHTMRALCQMIVQLSQDRPLLFVFEDLHWIDPTSLELLDIALDAISGEKILILATARPTFEHGFGGHPSSTRIALNRLGGDQIQGIVERLTGGRALPEEVLQLIVSRTDGVPLFVEELTKTILEAGVLKVRGDSYVLDGPLDLRAIPSTLHDSLMARLDRLQPIKAVAQTAACIGRKFEHRLLASISPLPAVELNTALEGLIKAELVFRRGEAPEAHYIFNHALVRDAAYESLLKDNRRATHRRIVQSLELDGNAAPEVLAWHAEAAGLTEQAINLWEAASKAAIARPAFDEAISHLGHAMALLSPQINDGTQAILEQALGLQIQLGAARLFRNGYGADETKAAFEHALLLADKIGETPLRFTVLYGLWVNKYVRAQHADALTLAESLLELVEGGTDSTPIMLATRIIGVSLSLGGRFVEAQHYLSRGDSLFDPVTHKGLANRFGQDLGVANSCYMALNLWALGETRQANTHMLEAERAALLTGHSNTICYMHCHVVLLALLARDEAVIESHAAAMTVIANEHKLLLWQDFAGPIQALQVAGAGDALGIDQFMVADTQYTASKSHVFLTLIRIEASYRALALDLVEKARTLADMARTLIDQTGETYLLAELYRLDGALALKANNQNEAEVSLKEAVAVARKQGSKSLELRAALDLADLWQAMGRTTEACSVLKLAQDNIADGDCAEDSARAKVFLSGM